MKIAVLSDLHGYVPSPAAQAVVDKADVVCICGDVESRNVSYLDENYAPAFLPALVEI